MIGTVQILQYHQRGGERSQNNHNWLVIKGEEKVWPSIALSHFFQYFTHGYLILRRKLSCNSIHRNKEAYYHLITCSNMYCNLHSLSWMHFWFHSDDCSIHTILKSQSFIFLISLNILNKPNRLWVNNMFEYTSLMISIVNIES